MTLTPKNWAEFQHYKDRSPAWIKLHRGLLDDYTFACLPVASRALAPLLWLLASEYENGAITATHAEIAFRLRMTEKDLVAALNPLIEKRFFILEQDASAALAGCKQDAIPEREREIEEQEEKEIDIRAVAIATRPDEFEDFWKSYPRRDGANPKAPARKKFTTAVKSGVPAEAIIAAAKRYSAHCQTKQQINTPYVAQAVTWLSQQRWGDYPEAKTPTGVHGPPSADLPTDQELRRKYEALNEQRGRTETPQPSASAERGADLEGNLLGARPDDDSVDVPGGQCAGDLAGKPGVRRLADLLPRPFALAAMGIRSDTEG